ncbi:MAG: RNA polymerase sigma factor [Candidatus Saccharimonadales bacterium]
MKEKLIITRVLEGETDSYRELVERYQTGLIIHCENILNDRQDGEDMAQEAFIKAFKSLKTFSSEKARFSTWLYRIASNLCVDFLRKNKKVFNVEDIERYTQAIDPAYIEMDEIEKVRMLVEQLEPPKYAEVIKAYFWEGKSYQEIAAIFNTTTNTIGSWINRAKSQLRKELS